MQFSMEAQLCPHCLTLGVNGNGAHWSCALKGWGSAGSVSSSQPLLTSSPDLLVNVRAPTQRDPPEFLTCVIFLLLWVPSTVGIPGERQKQVLHGRANCGPDSNRCLCYHSHTHGLPGSPLPVRLTCLCSVHRELVRPCPPVNGCRQEEVSTSLLLQKMNGLLLSFLTSSPSLLLKSGIQTP